VGDKPLPEVGQVADHKAHLLSQWATPKVKQFCKIEKQTVTHSNMLRAGGWVTLPQRKEVRQRNKPPVNSTAKSQLQSRTTVEQISWTWGQHSDLNCHTSLREETTK
jgi:hypothetical protein